MLIDLNINEIRTIINVLSQTKPYTIEIDSIISKIVESIKED